jgi:regulator of sirC expression with transglutaminase-like and TPR domain
MIEEQVLVRRSGIPLQLGVILAEQLLATRIQLISVELD